MPSYPILASKPPPGSRVNININPPGCFFFSQPLTNVFQIQKWTVFLPNCRFPSDGYDRV